MYQISRSLQLQESLDPEIRHRQNVLKIRRFFEKLFMKVIACVEKS